MGWWAVLGTAALIVVRGFPSRNKVSVRCDYGCLCWVFDYAAGMANRKCEGLSDLQIKYTHSQREPVHGGACKEMDKGKERSCRCCPSTHGEQSEEDSGQIYNELLALHWWLSSFRCSSKWQCFLWLGWPAVVISGRQHHIIGGFNTLCLHLHIRLGLCSPVSSEDGSCHMQRWVRSSSLWSCPKGHHCAKLFLHVVLARV